MTQFYGACFESAKDLLRALAIGVGLEDEDYFMKYHSGVNNQVSDYKPLHSLVACRRSS